MTDRELLKRQFEFVRQRTLGSIERLEKLPNPQAALSFRPGPARAHIGWLLMHLAATDDKVLNQYMMGKAPIDPDLVEKYGGGSTPSDTLVPTVKEVRENLEKYRPALLEFIDTADFAQTVTIPGRGDKTVLEWLQILAWHEPHHQGQVHLALNMFESQQR